MTRARALRLVHAEPDRLSAYLDGELAAEEAREIEEHVAGCPGCRAELDGLAAVVGTLRRLEREAPPQVLAQRVTRRVAVEGRRADLIARIEAALQRWNVEPGTLVTFGVVIALAAMLALLGSSLEEAGRRRGAMEREWSGLHLVTAVVGDHRFDRDGGLWREVGSGEPEVRLAADSPEARAILAATPRLGDLLAHSEGVVLVDADGRTVLIYGTAPPSTPFPPGGGKNDAPTRPLGYLISRRCSGRSRPLPRRRRPPRPGRPPSCPGGSVPGRTRRPARPPRASSPRARGS